MGVETDHMGLDEARAAAMTHLVDERPEVVVHVGEPCAVHLDRAHVEPARDVLHVRAGLDFLRHADGVTVVLDEEEHGQLLADGPVERFEELPLAGGAFSRRDIDDLVKTLLLDGTGTQFLPVSYTHLTLPTS